MNAETVLNQIRMFGPLTRPELARESGLSKPTISLALETLERQGLIHICGLRSGSSGPRASLYEIHPEAGFVLGLDVGRHYLRGALADLSGTVRARGERQVDDSSSAVRVSELTLLAKALTREATVSWSDVTQTVVGSPGVYDAQRDVLLMARGLPGWQRAGLISDIRKALGTSTMVENDINLAALAEQEFGHGKGINTFAFVSVGTGVGLGLIIDHQIHRGYHGAAGEIGFLPIFDDRAYDATDARRRGSLEASASGPAVVRAARRSGMGGALSARAIFAAAKGGDERAISVIEHEADSVARAIATVIVVVDPQLVVLGGGIGRAPGFADSVAAKLRQLVPVMPEMLVSKLGENAVVEGCLAAGSRRAWQSVVERIQPS